MKMDTLWEESLGHRLKVERNLNFSTISNEDDEFGFSRKKTARDPMSHRIIEKRRRDRMNNCLADLSRLVPTNYLKKGRGRIEKTEIIEMAIKHLKHLQAHPCKDPATCEVAKATEQDHKRQYRLGFQECMSETLRFLVEIEGLYAADGLCVRLVNHLQKHYDKVAGGMCYTQALGMMSSEEGKILPMDVEHSSPNFCVDNYSEMTGTPDTSQTNVMETRHSEVTSAGDVLKQESDVNPNTTNGNFQDSQEFGSRSSAPLKVSSQLREMLQNPGLPKDSNRSHSSTMSSPQHSVQSTVNTNGHDVQSHSAKNEEVYKFKNNIKHRFNADLRHHTSSPTDSHCDRSSLPDDDRTSSEARSYQAQSNSEERLGASVLCHHGHSNTHGHHRSFSPFPTHHELSVKIPERTVAESTAPGHWDCRVETGSSCGSNPSTPPVAPSNGSSSGYSTNGEMPPGSKLKAVQPGQHSPAVSPYSRTPDHILNRSPSPQHPQRSNSGVPVFALHSKGAFYIPLTIDSGLLAPYLEGMDELAPVVHPVSICVNFSLCQALKVDKLNGSAFQFRNQSFFMDRFNERYLYGDRHPFYPSSPVRN